MKIKSESPIPIEEAAQLLGRSVRTLLSRAGQGEILLHVGLTEFSATLMARPWCANPLPQTLRQAPNSYEILGTRYANDLAISGQAVIASCPASIEPPMDDYFWHLETPQTVGIDRIFMMMDMQAHREETAFQGSSSNLVQKNGANQVDAAAVEEIGVPNWKMSVQAQAATLWRRYRAQSANPTKNSLKDDLAKWCRENKVKTATGINPDAAYIARHVLKDWTPPSD